MEDAKTAAKKAAGEATTVGIKGIKAVVEADVKNVQPYIFNATCCSINSIGVNFPQCLGWSNEGVCCGCIAYKSAACKPVVDDPGNPDVKCICSNAYCVFIQPGEVLCKDFSQAFCCEHRCALPCDEDVPCACALCFVSCFKEPAFTTSPKVEIKVLERLPDLPLKAPDVPRMSRMMSRA